MEELILGKAKVTFESEGHKIIMDVTTTEEETQIKVTAENPLNLKEHKGIHTGLFSLLCQALTKE